MTFETERSRVAQRVLAEVARHEVPSDLDGGLFRDFARETIGRIRGPFLAQHPPRHVLRYLEAAFRFALVRTPGEIHVDVRRPAGRGLLVVSHMDDQPFIVDTIRLFFKRAGADYWGGFNVIFPAHRDAEGRLVGVGGDAEADGAVVESLAMLEADDGQLDGSLDEARTRLVDALAFARATVADFRGMTRAVERFAERLQSRADARPDQAEAYRETAAFLEWLSRENFVFMGVRAGEQRMGVEALDGPFTGDPGGPWTQAHPPGTVFVRKSTTDSPIHRSGRIDEILVLRDADDAPSDGLFLRGMFTYRAVTQPSRQVPVLRWVLREELASQGARPGSFRYKGIANVFDSLPTEFLFNTPRSAISEMIDLVLDSEQQQEVGVTVLTGEDASAFVLVSMPKRQYSDALRREVEGHVVAALGASYHDHGLHMSRFDTVLLHYYLTGLRTTDDGVVSGLAEQIRELATPWTSRLWQAIAEAEDEERADYLVDTYGRAFPEDYTRRTPIARAVRDIAMLDALAGRSGVLADAFEESGEVVLRIYQARDVYLTRLLPVLDNFGLTVKSADIVRVASRGGKLQFDSFALELDDAAREQLFDRRPRFVDALRAIFDGDLDDDELNKLVLTAGLPWRAVDVLRAYSHYLRQLQLPVATGRFHAILLQHPQTCEALHALFRARHDPDVDDRDAAVEAAEARVQSLLRLITTHDEDLVFRAMYHVIRATVRTNAYRTDRKGHYLSFKLDARSIREMKGARPLFEIYVHSPQLEGVHLRFGTVARGGLRWSDRADFRTEVLGLVTTQQVKNVVIVPEGSKGGFFLRKPESDRGALRKQADKLYQQFIRGLLDVTDNVVDGEIVGPPRVVRHDAPDPYLVVAADKGTAHLSDTANGISEAYGFWLGDAFASGGSNGYDHKKVGITARGAWVLVRRHFAEMGRDPYAEPFTAAGVGDMGGDVFGNGLLESKQTKLLAAFNHVHVFLDPDPDPAASWTERKRLFDVAGREAGWDQYDRSVLSEGGGVFDRGAKSIPLSPQAREMLGLDVEEASPEEVIRAILRMEVDLMWSGGIGTYVKASHETHDDADDRGNDRFRVNASELRCKVVGEGANLSFTQAARIEADLAGIRLNTDFIDNSGGVDMSDHEVNLKILLSAPEGRGELDRDARNALLEALTEEVAGLVLANNDTQGRQLSRDRIRSVQDVFPFGRAIAFVERVFGVERETLHLPSDEVLAERAASGAGLTRPELATLSSWVKRYVFSELVASGQAKEITGYTTCLETYFPDVIRERYLSDIHEHQLADEIAMTVTTTQLVGDAGAAFVPLAVESTGRSVAEIAEAYLRSQRLARAQEVRHVLEELRTSVSLSGLYGAWVAVDAGCRDVAAWWLGAGNRVPTDAELDDMAGAADEVYRLQADDVRQRNTEILAGMEDDDIPSEVAERVLKARYLNAALMSWSHARKLGVDFSETVVRQLAAGRATRLQEVLDDLATRTATGEWEPIAIDILHQRFMRILREVVRAAGTDHPARSVAALEPMLRDGPLADVRAQVDNMLDDDDAPELALLLVLEERLAGAVARLA